jgi:hypothetical protein
MKLKYKSLCTASLVAVVALTSLVVSPFAMANDNETACINDIQGKLAWNDDDNNMNWDAENVKQLCSGTANPAEPRKCFSNVKKNRVNWGKGTDWEWKNIINLCSGTDDADKTLECFNKGVAAGTDWRDVILLCQRAHKSTHANKVM